MTYFQTFPMDLDVGQRMVEFYREHGVLRTFGYHNEFASDLAQSCAAVLESAYILHQYGFDIVDMPKGKLPYDFEFKYHGTTFRVEVKDDPKSVKTGNIAIEYATERCRYGDIVPSGVSLLDDDDIWIHRCGDNGQQKYLFLMRVGALKRYLRFPDSFDALKIKENFIKEYGGKTTVCGNSESGCNYSSKLLLVPIPRIRDEFHPLDLVDIIEVLK